MARIVVGSGTAVRSTREAAGLTQYEAAVALGTTQSTVARAESGKSMPKTEDLVQQLKTLGPDKLRDKYLEVTGQKPKTDQDVADAPPPQKKGVPKRGKNRSGSMTPAIVNELRAFCKKHGLTPAEAAVELGGTSSFIGFSLNNKVTVSADQVEVLRERMKSYSPIKPGQFTPSFDHTVPNQPNMRRAKDGSKIDIKGPADQLELSVRSANAIFHARIGTIEELTYRSEGSLLKIRHFGMKSLKEVRTALSDYGLKLGTVAPKPAKLNEPAAPVPPPPPTVANPTPGVPPVPSVKLVAGQGIRLNNGDNVAPHLRIDGKTMHVFTLVPGGVFLSYVAAETE